jgi:hypothetical protein
MLCYAVDATNQLLEVVPYALQHPRSCPQAAPHLPVGALSVTRGRARFLSPGHVGPKGFLAIVRPESQLAQKLRGALLVPLHCIIKGPPPRSVKDINRRTACQEHLQDGDMTRPGRKVCSRKPIGALKIRICPPGQKNAHDVGVAKTGCGV